MRPQPKKHSKDGPLPPISSWLRLLSEDDDANDILADDADSQRLASLGSATDSLIYSSGHNLSKLEEHVISSGKRVSAPTAGCSARASTQVPTSLPPLDESRRSWCPALPSGASYDKNMILHLHASEFCLKVDIPSSSQDWNLTVNRSIEVVVQLRLVLLHPQKWSRIIGTQPIAPLRIDLTSFTCKSNPSCYSTEAQHQLYTRNGHPTFRSAFDGVSIVSGDTALSETRALNGTIQMDASKWKKIHDGSGMFGYAAKMVIPLPVHRVFQFAGREIGRREFEVNPSVKVRSGDETRCMTEQAKVIVSVSRGFHRFE